MACYAIGGVGYHKRLLKPVLHPLPLSNLLCPPSRVWQVFNPYARVSFAEISPPYDPFVLSAPDRCIRQDDRSRNRRRPG